mmetsp:Transcript_56689/g.106377  ORF Transcript_56689/g.106377 Transcript_56689/m.106377 type:complete len:204 (+) Transcript_56689:393-1004(+)
MVERRCLRFLCCISTAAPRRPAGLARGSPGGRTLAVRRLAVDSLFALWLPAAATGLRGQKESSRHDWLPDATAGHREVLPGVPGLVHNNTGKRGGRPAGFAAPRPGARGRGGPSSWCRAAPVRLASRAARGGGGAQANQGGVEGRRGGGVQKDKGAAGKAEAAAGEEGSGRRCRVHSCCRLFRGWRWGLPASCAARGRPTGRG